MEKEFTSVREFSFDAQRQMVRTMIDRNGELWFVAQDVCDVLEHSNSRMAIQSLDEDEKGVSKVYTLTGEKEANIINESGLYNLIFRSNKPQAKLFRKWVTSEVLPAIRKQGGYLVNQPLDVPEDLHQVCALYTWARKQRLALSGQLKKIRATETACMDRISLVAPPLHIAADPQQLLNLPVTETEVQP